MHAGFLDHPVSHNLETFRVRGGNGLSFAGLTEHNLKKLIIETGGLDKSVVNQLMTANFPNCEHLELWLGTDNYGGNVGVADLQPLLDGAKFPSAKYLALCNYDEADTLAIALEGAAILNRIETLDMSKGTMSDKGAEALLKNEGLKSLKMLDLHHHWISNEMMAKLTALGIPIDLDEQEDMDEEEDYRYVYCGE